MKLVSALIADLDWLREHTRYLQRATEWDEGGRSANRLLSGPDIATAKAWAARRPKDAPEPTELQLDLIKASEEEDDPPAERGGAAAAGGGKGARPGPCAGVACDCDLRAAGKRGGKSSDGHAASAGGAARPRVWRLPSVVF